MKIGNATDLALALSYVNKGGLVLDIDVFFNAQGYFDRTEFLTTLELIFQKKQPSFLGIFSLQFKEEHLTAFMNEDAFVEDFMILNSKITSVFNFEISQFIMFDFMSLANFLRFVMQYVTITLQTCITVITKNPLLPASVFHHFYQSESNCLTVISLDTSMYYSISENTFQMSRLGSSCPRKPSCKPCDQVKPEESIESTSNVLASPEATACPRPEKITCPAPNASRFETPRNSFVPSGLDPPPTPRKPLRSVSFHPNPDIAKNLFSTPFAFTECITTHPRNDITEWSFENFSNGISSDDVSRNM